MKKTFLIRIRPSANHEWQEWCPPGTDQPARFGTLSDALSRVREAEEMHPGWQIVVSGPPTASPQ